LLHYTLNNSQSRWPFRWPLPSCVHLELLYPDLLLFMDQRSRLSHTTPMPTFHTMPLYGNGYRQRSAGGTNKLREWRVCCGSSGASSTARRKLVWSWYMAHECLTIMIDAHGEGIAYLQSFPCRWRLLLNGPTCLGRCLDLAILLSGLEEEEHAARQEPLSLVPLDMHAR
jgi:hypothetical protein